MSNTTEKKEKQNFGQFIKFALFSASAGIIQVLTFTLLSEVVVKLPAIQSAMESNATFARIMQNEYGPMYLTALILWCGTSPLTANSPLSPPPMCRWPC